MEHSTLIILIAGLFGFIMLWSVGANDLANVMSTTMGSKALTVRQAMIIAVVFEFAGAILGGSGVTTTIRSGIIDTSALTHAPDLLMHGMLAVLLAGTAWMLLASYLGLPVSITNAIVGGLVGFGMIVLGVHAIYWTQVRWIALSWVISPLSAGIIAYILFRSLQRSILTAINPLRNAQRYMPVYFFLIGIVLAFMVVLKGIKHAGILLSTPDQGLVVLGTAVIIACLGFTITQQINLAPDPTGRDRFAPVEKLFGWLMAFTACAMVFAHGSNDVAIAIGPVVAIMQLLKTNNHVLQDLSVSNTVVVFGCVSVVIGLLMYGRKVIATVGSGITALTPSRAFAATIAAASVVVISTSIGIPVSATQTLVGAVLGVGLARGIGALNITVVRNILLSWIITIPASSLLAIMFFYLLQNL
jgi:inorganic phosphate transporter, PiT family